MAVDETHAAAGVPAALAELGFRFAHKFRVRYRDIDIQGIVFNGNYLSYVDYGITEYLRHLGYGWKNMGPARFDLALVRSEMNFRAGAHLDDIIHAGVRVVRVGNTSFTARFALLRQDEDSGEEGLVLDAENVYVNYNARERKARPIPADVRAKIKALEGEVEGL